ncbi:MAG: flagellar basal body rod protein FlgB [Verrucomicrobiales bacterium]|nr:flagellar basal body rod protein FlgB [Verrucomicrobiales bacterium]
MIDALFSQSNYLAAKKMLDATALRQEAIARNLANIETPHYQRVDLAPSFSTALNQAIAAHDSARIKQVQPSIAIDGAALPSGPDGNTVDLETELLNLSRNSVAHTLETQLVTGQFARLRLAITGRNI